MKIGLYPMVADVLHTGHITAIEEAKEHCDYLIIALHCNPIYKTPVQSIYERYMQLRAVKWVDEIIPYNNIDDVRTLLLSLKYDVYFLGEDYKGKSWEGSDILYKLDKEIYFLKRVHQLSSSELKNRIVNEQVKKSNSD